LGVSTVVIVLRAIARFDLRRIAALFVRGRPVNLPASAYLRKMDRMIEGKLVARPFKQLRDRR
jgi:hypothetical protein